MSDLRCLQKKKLEGLGQFHRKILVGSFVYIKYWTVVEVKGQAEVSIQQSGFQRIRQKGEVKEQSEIQWGAGVSEETQGTWQSGSEHRGTGEFIHREDN